MNAEYLTEQFNALNIEGMSKVSELHKLSGSFINLEYTLPSGQKVKLWDDNKTYLGNEICKKNSDRCFGLVTDGQHLLVCEYGEGGKDAEIIVYKKLLP